MDYDALEKRLRDLGMYSAELAADAIADLRARNEALAASRCCKKCGFVPEATD